MTRKTDRSPPPGVAAPPNAPEGFDELLAAVLAALEGFRPDGETRKKLDRLNAKKALALLATAAYHLSRLPDHAFRQSILFEAASLLDALVKENEARHDLAEPPPDRADKRLH